MFQIFEIRELTAFVSRMAKANCFTSNPAAKLLLGVLVTLFPAAAQIQTICTTNAWDTMTAGPTVQGNYYDNRVSSGTSYTTEECTGYYTVDIVLPGSYFDPTIGNAIDIGAGFAQPSQLTQSTCQFASVSLLVYKRNSFGGSWRLVSSQNMTGTWFQGGGEFPSFCSLPNPLRVVAPGNNVPYDVYRVLVLPKLFNAPVQAEVSWHWTF